MRATQPLTLRKNVKIESALRPRLDTISRARHAACIAEKSGRKSKGDCVVYPGKQLLRR